MAKNQPPADARKPAQWFYLLDDHGFPLFPFPTILIPILVLGVLAGFCLVGYVGYPADNKDFYLFSHPAWILFAWFGLVILTILWTIFKLRPAPGSDDRDVRRWRWSVTIATLLFMALDAAVYAQPRLLLNLATNVIRLIGPSFSGGRVLWNLGNFLIIGWYVVDRFIQIGRWQSRERRAWTATVMVQSDRLPAPAPANTPQKQSATLNTIKLLDQPLGRYEVVSHNIFAGGALCLALGFILQADVLNAILRFFPPHFVEPCPLTLAIGACQSGAVSGNPPSLHTVDWVLAGIAFLVSLIILLVVLLTKIYFLFRNMNFARALMETLLETLRSLGILIVLIIPNLRAIIWPLFIAMATTAAGVSARLIEMYLHVVSDKRTCLGSVQCPDIHEFSFFLGTTDSTKVFQDQAPIVEAKLLAIVLGLVVAGILCELFAARLLLFGRVEGALRGNWLRYALVTWWLVICLFWVFSLILALVTFLTQLTGVSPRIPFPGPGVPTIISVAIFLVSCTIIVARQLRSQPDLTPRRLLGLIWHRLIGR